MTTVATSTMPAVRIAQHNGTCGAPGCTVNIWPGAPIVQPAPGRAWWHADCSRPGRRSGEDRAADRLLRRRRQ